jgi:hypothetical protein
MPLDFYLRDDIKNIGNPRKQLQDLRHSACAAIPRTTVQEAWHYVALVNIALWLVVNTLSMCEFKVTSTKMG